MKLVILDDDDEFINYISDEVPKLLKEISDNKSLVRVGKDLTKDQKERVKLLTDCYKTIFIEPDEPLKEEHKVVIFPNKNKIH